MKKKGIVVVVSPSREGRGRSLKWYFLSHCFIIMIYCYRCFQNIECRREITHQRLFLSGSATGGRRL